MKLEDQVVSLELAKELKELGFEQNGLHAYYFNAGEYTGAIVDGTAYADNEVQFKQSKLIYAYTVAELGEMLPDDYESGEIFNGESTEWDESGTFIVISKDENRWSVGANDELYVHDAKLADAMAKMLIYLKENELI